MKAGIEEDVAKCHNHFHGVNVVKCGGLTWKNDSAGKSSW
jgi:hypothetical protein